MIICVANNLFQSFHAELWWTKALTCNAIQVTIFSSAVYFIFSLNIFILWYHEDILLITFIYLIALVGWSAHVYVCVASIFTIPVDCFCAWYAMRFKCFIFCFWWSSLVPTPFTEGPPFLYCCKVPLMSYIKCPDMLEATWRLSTFSPVLFVCPCSRTICFSLALYTAVQILPHSSPSRMFWLILEFCISM